MDWSTIQQMVRKGADAFAGYLVTVGIIDDSISMTVSGLVVGVVSVGWWWYWNKFRTPATPA